MPVPEMHGTGRINNLRMIQRYYIRLFFYESLIWVNLEVHSQTQSSRNAL